MVWSLVIAGLVTLIVAFLTLLPSAGCGSLSWTALELGPWASFINLPVVLAGFGTIVAFEIGYAGFRLSLWFWNLVRP